MRIVLAVAAAAAAALAGAAGAAAEGGSAVWQQAGCGGCHTLAAAGATGTVGPNLDLLRPSAATVAAQVRGGGGGMPSFAGSLSSTQIDAVAAWVSSSAGGGTTAAATGTASAPGVRGSWVRRLQVELRRLGFFHGPTTGFYGPLTTAAVRAFQRSEGLAADGAWGPATKAALRKAAGPSPAARTGGTLPPPAPWVARLQADLARLSFFHGPDTGVYGPLTRAAVRRFQAAAGLVVDGRWGPASQAALVRRLRG